MIKCFNCGKEIREDHSYCPYCGTKQNTDLQNRQTYKTGKIIICDICGEETSDTEGFCQSCGAKLSGKENIVSEVKQQVSSPVESKPTGIKKEPVGYKKKSESKNLKKTEPKVETKKISLSGTQILLLAASVIVVGYLILELSGVFDKKEPVQQVQNEPSGQNNISLEEINELNSLESAVRSDSTNSIRILELAHKLNDTGFFERATEYYKMYLRQNPGNADVLVDLGVCYFELKKYDEAKTWMRRGLKVNPDHQIGNFNLGIVNLSAGNLDSAKYWWDKAAALNPSSEIGKRAKELLESH